MSKPREDANCYDCTYRRTCGKFYYKDFNIETGKPNVDCYGYSKEMTEAEWRNSTWGNVGK